jgi:hypothetical protein
MTQLVHADSEGRALCCNFTRRNLPLRRQGSYLFYFSAKESARPIGLIPLERAAVRAIHDISPSGQPRNLLHVRLDPDVAARHTGQTECLLAASNVQLQVSLCARVYASRPAKSQRAAHSSLSRQAWL